MSVGACRRRVVWPNGISANIAISVRRVHLCWHVTLRPGYAIVNHLNQALHLSFQGDMAHVASPLSYRQYILNIACIPQIGWLLTCWCSCQMSCNALS